MTILPGTVGPLVHLQDARREVYERQAKRMLDLIESRRQKGIPLDDATDWESLAPLIEDARQAFARKETGKLREKLSTLLERTAGALEPLPPYEPRPDLDGIRVAFRKVSDEVFADCIGGVQEVVLQVEGLPPTAIRDAMLAGVRSASYQKKLIAHAVAQIEGLPEPLKSGAGSPLPEDVLDHVKDCGLLADLFIVAREYQNLRPFERPRFGSSPPSTSETSGATSAQSPSEGSSDATAPETPSTSAAPLTSPAPALGVSSYEIPASPISSSSTGAPTAGSAASMG